VVLAFADSSEPFVPWVQPWQLLEQRQVGRTPGLPVVLVVLLVVASYTSLVVVLLVVLVALVVTPVVPVEGHPAAADAGRRLVVVAAVVVCSLVVAGALAAGSLVVVAVAVVAGHRLVVAAVAVVAGHNLVVAAAAADHSLAVDVDHSLVAAVAHNLAAVAVGHSQIVAPVDHTPVEVGRNRVVVAPRKRVVVEVRPRNQPLELRNRALVGRTEQVLLDSWDSAGNRQPPEGNRLLPEVLRNRLLHREGKLHRPLLDNPEGDNLVLVVGRPSSTELNFQERCNKYFLRDVLLFTRME